MTDDFRRDQRSSRRFGGSGDPSDGSDREDDEDASRRVGGGNDSDPPDDDDDGPRTSGGSPSVPGTIPDDPPDPEPDPPDDDPDPSPGPSSPGGSPSVPGGSDPEPPEPEPSDPSPEASTGSSSPTGTDREDDQDASQRVGGSGDPDDAVDQPDALDQAAQAYTRTVSEPVGDVVADASPITAAERATLGTNRSERFFESAGETVAEFGNVPGMAAGTRDVLERRSETQDPVGVGPFVATAGVPDAEGRREQARETVDAAAAVASRAANNPFSAAGAAFGSVAGAAGVAGAASRSSRLSRATARSRRSDSSDIDDIRDGSDAPTPDDGRSVSFGELGGEIGNVRRQISNRAGDVRSRAVDIRDRLDPRIDDSADAVPSGRSEVGTDGLGSVLDPDGVDAARGITIPSRRSVASGRARRALDDVRDRIDDANIAGTEERAQLGAPRRRPGESSDSPEFDEFDRTRPADAGGTFDDVRQDALTQTQDALRDQARRPDFGDFEGGPSPFGRGRGDVIDPDSGEVQLSPSTATPTDAGTATTGTATLTPPGASGAAGGIGTISAVNDPSGIAETDATFGVLDETNDPTGITDTDAVTGVREQLDTAADADSRSGFGVSALGEINDPTGIVSDSETAVGLGGRGTGVDTLGTIGTVNDQTDVAPTTETDTDGAFGTDTNTDTGLTTFSDTDTGTTTDTTETTTTDTTTTATTLSTPRTPPTTNNNDRFRLYPTDELGQTAGDGGLDGLDAVGETFENPTRSLDQVSQDLLEDIDGP